MARQRGPRTAPRSPKKRKPTKFIAVIMPLPEGGASVGAFREARQLAQAFPGRLVKACGV